MRSTFIICLILINSSHSLTVLKPEPDPQPDTQPNLQPESSPAPDQQNVNTDSLEGLTTETNEMPEFKTRRFNYTHRIMSPITGYEKHNQKYAFASLNSTHDVYRIESMMLKPGRRADTPLMRVGKFIGAIPILKRGLGVKCWDDIGCFSAINSQVRQEQDQSKRTTIGMLPMSPLQINVKFSVFTFKSQKESFDLNYNFDINSMKTSTFNESHQTVVIVHGFKSGLAQWMIDIKDMLFQLKHNEYNVVLVDWNAGSLISSYILAAANTQVVGALVAHFIDRITDTTYEKRMKSDLFYLIGHSLGAHIMGFAAKRLYRPKVSRITGLDPAGPLFEDHPPEMRLNYNDATIVDIIHTDMAESAIAGLGIFQPIGDMDFYPNGGKLQPGCPQTIMIVNVLKYPTEVSCSHSRSHTLSNAFGKVDSYCLPVGYICEHWETFIEGRCANCDVIKDVSQCQIMGLYPTFWKGVTLENKSGIGQKYYLNTARNNDFCLFHYQMAFHISKDSDPGSNGEIELIIGSEVHKVLTVNRVITRVYPGRIHTILVTFRSNVKIKSLSILWHSFRYGFTNGNRIKIDFVEINYLSHMSEKVRRKQSVLLCPSPNQEYGSDLYVDGPKITYITCHNQTNLAISALDYKVNLVPLTRSKDILTVDYENEELLTRKLYRNSNNYE